MRALIINNTNSGLRNGSIFDFMRRLDNDGDEMVVRNTDGTTRIEDLLKDAEGFDFVVASGGDGTIASVCYELRNSGIPILPFPAGTGNLLVTNLDQPDEPFAIAKMAKKANMLDYDLGELNFEDSGERVTRGFAIIAGAGYDANIMENAERLKETLGPMAYVVSALGNPAPTLAHFTITLDDRVVETDGIAVLLLNFAQIYPDVSITHDNDARDGLLEVVVIKPRSTVELLPAFISAFLDKAGRFPSRANAFDVFTSRNVHIKSDPPIRIQHDGEPTGAYTPLNAHALPAACRLIVSDDEYKRHTKE